MIDVMNHKSSIALKNVIQLNPFDAVVILKKQENLFYVEMANSRAAILFNIQYKMGMHASDFFAPELWSQLMENIDERLETIQTLKVDKLLTKNYLIQKLMTAEGTFYCFIFRVEAVQASTQLEKGEQKLKHLYFLEQYVNPVISLDLNGEIIYINQAAERKLLSVNINVVGKSIFDLVESEDKLQLEELFQRTIDGSPMGLPKVVLNNELLQAEPVSLNSFPTYWDGQVIGAHFVIKNITQLFKERDTYQYVSYFDELTKLYNRRALNDHWQSIMNQNKQAKYAVVLVDLDRFKRFNESLGKKKADQILATICNRFIKLRHTNCEVYRYNGDEFVFLINYQRLEDIENHYIKRIYEEINLPISFEHQEYYVTASIGIALSEGNKEVELDTLLLQADQALFHVKTEGRGQYKYYDVSMSKAFPNAALMESHLKRAIEFEEFSLYLQPQLDLKSRSVTSFEALIRWNNRKFGNVSPMQFIPLAESSGLIVEIGDWVLEKACEYLQDWQEKNFKPTRIAVNISPVQFTQPDFVSKVRNVITKYGIDPTLLELEITESSMTNIDETVKKLWALKRIGVFVAVDDFGTGYSSLSYLKLFPLDVIKIDQSFIMDISKDSKNEAIIEAIIAMSHRLGLEVVAEGVEEETQESFLRKHNCKKVQGYLYNRPLPVDEILKLYMDI